MCYTANGARSIEINNVIFYVLFYTANGARSAEAMQAFENNLSSYQGNEKLGVFRMKMFFDGI